MTEHSDPPSPDEPATSEAPPPEPAAHRRGPRFVVPALLVTASVLAVLAVFSVWANRQLLNAQNWSNTSSALLENSAIRTQISAYLVDQVYANTDVTGRVRQALPPRLKPLSGPAASSLHDLAERTTARALGRPRVQRTWEAANKVAAQQFINVAEGKSGAITSSGNAVVLDLGAVLKEIVARLGLPPSVSAKIPPSAGKIKILSGDQVTTLQDGANLLRGLAIVLPIVSFVLFALAVYLAGGRRRRTLLWAGVDLIAVGALILIARNLLGNYVVDALAKTADIKPAADAAWSIATSMLRDVAQATIIGAIPLVLAAVLAGPMRPAVGFRRAAAPWLRTRPDIAYGVLALIVLLVIAWGPIPATRKPIPVLIMIGLLILGLEALRRQTAEEFPDARAGEVSARLRERAGALRRHGPAPAQAASAPEAAGDGKLERLERLARLHDSGALSDGEYETEKAAVLSS